MTAWTPPGPALLFCPADRPDRYAKADQRSDGVILDLEDAVDPSHRPSARDALAMHPLDPERTIVRVNPVGTRDGLSDLAAMAQTPYRCVMLAKTESAGQVEQVHTETGLGVLALVETPRGVVHAEQIAAASGCVGLMWGAEDLVAAMGGTASRFGRDEQGPARTPGQYRDVPTYSRARVAVAAAAFGRFAVDAVHLDITDTDGLHAEAVDAVALGFAATACIHPDQVAVVRAAYAPSDEEVAWAQKVVETAADQGGLFRLEGRMVDGPVLKQAEAVLRRRRAQ